MRTTDILRAWKAILAGRTPALSVEITKECPLACPGCYAYGDEHLGGNVVHTGQLYFPDAVTDAAYRKAPYASRPTRSTRNANDAIYRNGGKKSLLSVRKSGSVHVATITMGVHRG